MNKLHQEIEKELWKAQGDKSKHSGNDHYLLSGHKYYLIRNPRKRAIAKDWAKKHQKLDLISFIEVLNCLYGGQTYEEKTITGELLLLFPELRKQIPLVKLGSWLGELNGWAEVDATCQGKFGSQDLLNDWKSWKGFLAKLAVDNNINKRRASIVLLITPVSQTFDQRLSKMSFVIIDKLKEEKAILITKAVSWMLRSLIKYYSRQVRAYLEINFATLPKVAVRETRNKLLTGKK